MSMASPAILSNFFEKKKTQNHPQYLSGLSRALYPTTFLEIAVYTLQLLYYASWCVCTPIGRALNKREQKSDLAFYY